MLKRRNINKEPQNISKPEHNTKDEEEEDTKENNAFVSLDETTKIKIKTLQFDSIVLSAGTNLFKMLAVLDVLNKNKKIHQITKYIGSSAGAMICLFLLLDLTPHEIFEKLCQVQFEPLIAGANLSNIYTHSSLLSSNILVKIIQDIIISKIGFDITLAELFELTKKKLIVTVFNFTDYKIEYVTHETHPHFLCAEIIAASCSIPFIFSKLKIHEKFYLDGGVFDNFPLTHFLKNYPHSTTCAIVLSDNFQAKEQIELRNNSTPLSFLIDVAWVPNRLNTIKKINKNKDKENVCIISINSAPSDGLKFHMSSVDKYRIFTTTMKAFKQALF